MKRVVSNSVVAFLLMLIMGCGFHLRGAADLSEQETSCAEPASPPGEKGPGIPSGLPWPGWAGC